MIAAFAQALRIRGAPPPGLTTWNGSDPAQRFAVYRNNVAASLNAALAAIFPRVVDLVGADCFAALAGVYAEARPPRARRLALYGDGFADFLDGFAPLADWPYLGDVARLEAARLAAYHAADAPPLAASAVEAAGDLAGARVTLHPSVRLVASRFAVVSLVARLEAGGTLDGLAVATPETALVARVGEEVRVVTLSPGAAAFVTATREGASLYDAALAACARETGFDAGGFVRSLVEARLVVALTPSHAAPEQ